MKPRPAFPQTREQQSRIAQELKERAFEMANRAREMDESDADLSQYQEGYVHIRDSYLKSGQGISVTESLNFDPKTSELKRYQYLMNVKGKNADGEVYRQHTKSGSKSPTRLCSARKAKRRLNIT